VFLNGHYPSTPHSSPRYSHHPKSQKFHLLRDEDSISIYDHLSTRYIAFRRCFIAHTNQVILRHSDIDYSTQLRACFAPPPLSAIIWSTIYTTTPPYTPDRTRLPSFEALNSNSKLDCPLEARYQGQGQGGHSELAPPVFHYLR